MNKYIQLNKINTELKKDLEMVGVAVWENPSVNTVAEFC